ncbi:unnamed protein product, partial [Heterosigma akashiwo]
TTQWVKEKQDPEGYSVVLSGHSSSSSIVIEFTASRSGIIAVCSSGTEHAGTSDDDIGAMLGR